MQAVFALSEGSYHFRADYDGVQFWSGSKNHCTLPGCESAQVLLPGVLGQTTVTTCATKWYRLRLRSPSRSTPEGGYRLTAADYSTSDFYHYAYDAVGNRLTQESTVDGLPSTVAYTLARRGCPYPAES